MPFVAVAPLSRPIAFTVFIFACGILVLERLASQTFAARTRNLGAWIFLFLIFISLPIALANGVGARDWLFRGAFPFLFFFLALFFVPVREPRFLVRTIVQSSVIWACFVFFQIALNFEQDVARFTYLSRDLLLPYNLVAIPLLLFCSSYFSRLGRLAGVALFLSMTLAAGYRSHLLILGVVLAAFALSELRAGKVMFPLTIAAIVGALAAWFVSTPAGMELIARATTAMSADLGRIAEARFAFEKFSSSPLLGVGLGTPIPPEVTFAGRESYSDKLLATYGADYTVAYMHNFLLYMLMSFGLIGTASYAWLLLAGSRMSRAPLLRGPARVGVLVSLLSILVFTLVAATFTLLQWQVLVATLLKLLGSIERR